MCVRSQVESQAFWRDLSSHIVTDVGRAVPNSLQMLQILWRHFSITGLLSLNSANGAGATPWDCELFTRRHQDLNLTKLRALSSKVFDEKRLRQAERLQLMPETERAFDLRDEMLAACPCALLVACALQLGVVAHNVENGGADTNWAHETKFHRMALLQKAVEEAAQRCTHQEARTWPVKQAATAPGLF